MLNGATKTNQAYAALRRAIVVGDLPEDLPLEDAVLTERFGFGRTPLREAIKRLSDEQFINYPPHRTPYVRGIRVMELARLYEARHLLEEPVARQAAQRASATQIMELERICIQIDAAIERDDVYESVELDHYFHLSVARATDNRFLSEAVDRLNCGSLRLWYLAHSRLGMEHVNDDHRALHAAIRDRDADRAVHVMARHINTSYQRQIQQQQLGMQQLTQSMEQGESHR
jgi:GntR family transcriptional regulator, rspAB operon transcriptional repressor